MPATSELELRPILTDIYHAALAAVAPGEALRRALNEDAPASAPHILAIGKAAEPMAGAAKRWLEERGRGTRDALIISPGVGDHPEPGDRSLAAAEAVGRFVERARGAAEVWVLLSGGASSLIGAPLPALDRADFVRTWRLLLHSGLPIGEMNAVRKRITRWSGGRLATALAAGQADAVRPMHVRVYSISDVPGDDPSVIGSGPCAPDERDAAGVHELLERARLWEALPASVRDIVEGGVAGRVPETPKPGDAAFARVTTRIVATNALALDAAAAHAERRWGVRVIRAPALGGEARLAGIETARLLLDVGARGPCCLIRGGETTVTISGEPAGLGGRCQELALAAAEVLARTSAGHEPGYRFALLAAGTDGRDGPTDAAGAFADPDTWRAAAAAGCDPHRALAAHATYAALDAAAALFRTGPTETNVMDLVIGLAGPAGVLDGRRRTAGARG